MFRRSFFKSNSRERTISASTRMSPANESTKPANIGVSVSVWYQHVCACTSTPGCAFGVLWDVKFGGTNAGTPADQCVFVFFLEPELSVSRRKNRHRFSGAKRHHRSHAVATYRTYAAPCTARARSKFP